MASSHLTVGIDLTSGVIGGCSGIIVGQPFDTVKIRLQTQSAAYKGALDCVKQTVSSSTIWVMALLQFGL